MSTAHRYPNPRHAGAICLAGLVTLASIASAQASNSSKELGYSVTVTNVTKAIQFTPLIAASHTSAIALFELGQPAITPLAIVAEDGAVNDLRAILEDSAAVASVATTDGLLEAGASITFEITTDRRTRLLSLAAMLLPTNDSFVALESVQLPRRGSQTYYAHAYDAGTEPNDEDCAHIPGPVCQGEGRSDDDSNAEGFVHVSNGIHGLSSELSPAVYDWHGPVAEVTVTRIR